MKIIFFLVILENLRQVNALNYVFNQLNHHSNKPNLILKLKCFMTCVRTNDCGFVTIEQSQCKIYSKSSNLENSNFSGLYRKRPDFIYGIVNHWPIAGEKLNDIIGRKDLYGQQNAHFVKDRFGRENSSIRLNFGYLIIPAGHFFATEFSISIWAKFFNSEKYCRIFEFSNGRSTDNVIGLYTFADNRIRIGFTVYLPNPTRHKHIGYSSEQEINRWYHIVYVIQGNNVKIFLDKQLLAEGTGYSVLNRPRNMNFLGKSTWLDGLANAVFDDFKIFNRTLTNQEIADLYYFYN